MSATTEPVKFAWLLGREHGQRRNLRYWLMTSAIYVCMLVLQQYVVQLELASSVHAQALRLTIAAGVLAFFVAMRSGWSRRFADPALTAAQMAFAILMVAFAYLTMPRLGGALLMVVPLILLFGAFTLVPRRCRQLGWFAVLVQGGTAWLGWFNGGVDWQGRVEVIVFLLSAITYPMVAALAGRLSDIRTQLRVQKRELREAMERNQLLAKQDDLTGLPNRRHALEILEYEERRAQRQPVPPCVCLLDIDHFKTINDTHGHAAGDEVLRLMARHAVGALRTHDLLARWGGEEFLLLMPETPLPEAMQVVERLRQLLAQPGLWQERPELRVTFSAGVTSYCVGERMQVTLARADTALYQAKLQGRNRSLQG